MAAIHPFLVDRVWTEGQVRRWNLPRPVEAVEVRGYLGSTYYRKPEFVRFYVHESLRHLPLAALRHLAGMAELRLRLGAPPDPEVWRVSLKQVHPVDEPDGVWLTPRGPVAVEYDAGGYSRNRVRAKGEAFALRFVAQVWGAPIPQRVRTLEGLLPPSAQVVLAPWN
jgi:hypothetical protein